MSSNESKANANESNESNANESNESPHPATTITAATITVNVRNQQGVDTFFRVKRTTPFRKLFNGYANRTGAPIHTIRFLYDGERLDANDTMESAGLEDGDQIDALLEQTGGSI